VLQSSFEQLEQRAEAQGVGELTKLIGEESRVREPSGVRLVAFRVKFG